MAKLKPLDVATYGIATISTTTFTSHALWRAMTAASDYTGSLWLGASVGGAICAAISISQFRQAFGVRRRSRWASLGQHVQSFEPGVKTWIMKYKEPAEPIPEKYIFRGNGLHQPLYEETLYRFCKIGWRRQDVALSGSNTLLRQGDNFKSLRVSEILSERYFLRDARPRFTPDDVSACYHVLGTTYLMTGRKVGSSGRLIEPPGITVTLAARRWDALIKPPSKHRNGFFGMARFYN